MSKKKYIKKNNTLTCDVVKNGLILPRINLESGGEIRWGIGGVLDDNKVFVQSSFYDGGWAKHGGCYDFDNDKVEFIDEDVVYWGIFYSHWGHFLIDCCTRAWYVYQIAKNRSDFKVAILGEEMPSGNNLRFFELLGIKKEQLIQVLKPTRFRNIYIPEQGFKSCEWYSQEHLDMLDGVVENALNSEIDFSKVYDFDKVYFTRRLFHKAIDSEFGEKYLEQTFLKNGYRSISPEKLTLDEQIYIWNRASSICCVNGSIPLNVLFCRNTGLELIILNKTSLFHENPLILLEMRNISSSFINVFKEPVSGYPKSLGEGPFLFSNTTDFQMFCQIRKWKTPYNVFKCKLYYFIEDMKFYFYLTGVKRKIRLFLSHNTPTAIKNVLKQKRQDDRG